MRDSCDSISDDSGYDVDSGSSKLAQLYEHKSGVNKVYLPHQRNTVVRVIEGKPSSDTNNVTVQETSVDAYTLFADRTQVCPYLFIYIQIFTH